jgi:ATP/ADP translocase
MIMMNKADADAILGTLGKTRGSWYILSLFHIWKVLVANQGEIAV